MAAASYIINIVPVKQVSSQDFLWGVYLKNLDEAINVGMMGHGNAEDIRLKAGPGSCFP